ncbi:MFS transporter, partial [Chloroflexota bacterium]
TRVMVAMGVSGIAAAGLMVGLSQSYLALIMFLVIAALLGGGYHPSAASAISALVPLERRGRALGFHVIGGGASFWLVPLLAAPIALAWGWRGSFIALCIPAILLGVVLFLLIGQRTRARDGKRATTPTESAVEPSRIHWRQLMPFIIMSATTSTMIQSVSAYFSLYAVDHLGIAEVIAAMLMSITPAVGLLAGPIGGYLSDRFGAVTILAGVSLLAIPTLYFLGLVNNVLTLSFIMAVVGIISYFRMPTSESYIAAHTPKHRRSTILGFYFVASAEMGGLLTPVVGNLIDRFGFYSTFTILSMTQAIVIVTCLILLRRNRTLT